MWLGLVLRECGWGWCKESVVGGGGVRECGWVGVKRVLLGVVLRECCWGWC